MMNSWLPFWLDLTLATIFGFILIVHLYHIIVMAGRDRLWHCVHVLMATGMIVMFVRTNRMVVSNVVGGLIFAVAAVALAGLLVRERAAGHDIGMLWLVAVIDLAAMAYMFAMMDIRLLWLTIPLMGWFILQATGWSTGRLYAALGHGGLGGPRPDPAGSAVAARAPTSSGGEQRRRASSHHTDSDGAHRTVIRATLALMSVGMAYMLIAMQFGVATMTGMPGM